MMAAAPAKINLTLEVLALRPEGRHGLRSVAVPLDLSDTLSWWPHPTFRFSCSDGSLAHDDNLVLRAARAIGLDSSALALHLEKRIPHGSGLGGGSSDAATLLLTAMRGAFGPQPERDWLALADALGSDAPFFLVEAPALIEATGDRVTALGANPPWWAVLLCPPVRVSTRSAYAELEAKRARPPAVSRDASISLRMVDALQRRAFDSVCALLSNDFEATLFADPSMQGALDAFERAERTAHLSGSGSTLFTLCEEEGEAKQLSELFRADPHLLEAEIAIHAVPFRRSEAWRG
jgi:4-diphosphocytidyl-2-C-methyl-D-erythritol kinase